MIKNSFVKPTITFNILLFTICLVLFSCEKNSIKVEKRTQININQGWHYLENDTEDIGDAMQLKNWQSVHFLIHGIV